MSAGLALSVSVVLLVLNAFFVAAEFAVVAARRHRLEEQAAGGSRAAGAAVRASRELSLMLAGAQLGITLCTLGLGAVAKPAVADLLAPVLELLRLPETAAYVVSVVLAVALVVFLHMVVGEMAPKSWAISHPERSAVLLALPFRAFARVARPSLRALNWLANLCLRTVGVDPADTVGSAQDAEQLRLLLQASREHGTLEVADQERLDGVLRLADLILDDVARPFDQAVVVAGDVLVGEVEERSAASGRSRLFVLDGGVPVGLVHVRDAILHADRTAAATDLVGAVVRLPHGTVLLDAVGAMRRERAQLALVTGADGAVCGFTALEDLLETVLGPFDDETDLAHRLPPPPDPSGRVGAG